MTDYQLLVVFILTIFKVNIFVIAHCCQSYAQIQSIWMADFPAFDTYKDQVVAPSIRPVWHIFVLHF